MPEEPLPLTDILATQFNEAKTLRRSGNFAGAENSLTQMLSTLGESEPLMRVDILGERGINRRMLYRYGDGEADFTQALEISRSHQDTEREILSRIGLIDLYRTGDRNQDQAKPFSKDLDKARVQRQAVVELLRGVSSPTFALVKASIELGLLSDESSEEIELGNQPYTQAIEGAKVLVSTDATQENKDLLARALTTRGGSFNTQGRFEEALTLHLNAYNFYDELSEMRGKGNCASGAALAYKARGDKERAREWFERAQEAAMKDGQVVDKEIFDAVQKQLDSL